MPICRMEDAYTSHAIYISQIHIDVYTYIYLCRLASSLYLSQIITALYDRAKPTKHVRRNNCSHSEPFGLLGRLGPKIISSPQFHVPSIWTQYVRHVTRGLFPLVTFTRPFLSFFFIYQRNVWKCCEKSLLKKSFSFFFSSRFTWKSMVEILSEKIGRKKEKSDTVF